MNKEGALLHGCKYVKALHSLGITWSRTGLAWTNHLQWSVIREQSKAEQFSTYRIFHIASFLCKYNRLAQFGSPLHTIEDYQE